MWIFIVKQNIISSQRERERDRGRKKKRGREREQARETSDYDYILCFLQMYSKKVKKILIIWSNVQQRFFFFFVKMCYKCVSSKYVITSDKRFKITTFCTYYHRQSWRWWDIRWRWFSKCTSTAAYQQVWRLKTYLTHWPYTWTELSKLVTFFFFFFLSLASSVAFQG